MVYAAGQTNIHLNLSYNNYLNFQGKTVGSLLFEMYQNFVNQLRTFKGHIIYTQNLTISQ